MVKPGDTVIGAKSYGSKGDFEVLVIDKAPTSLGVGALWVMDESDGQFYSASKSAFAGRYWLTATNNDLFNHDIPIPNTEDRYAQLDYARTTGSSRRPIDKNCLSSLNAVVRKQRQAAVR